MIKGIETPNSKKQVKILQYADDSNFFLQDQNSLRNVLKYFKKLKKPTGSIRNLEKTTVLHINTDLTYQNKLEPINNLKLLKYSEYSSTKTYTMQTK